MLVPQLPVVVVAGYTRCARMNAISSIARRPSELAEIDVGVEHDCRRRLPVALLHAPCYAVQLESVALFCKANNQWKNCSLLYGYYNHSHTERNHCPHARTRPPSTLALLRSHNCNASRFRLHLHDTCLIATTREDGMLVIAAAMLRR